MFKPHYGICVCHNDKRMIVVKSGHCKQGNEEKKNAKKKAEGKYRPYRYERKKTGELDVFLEIWRERPHKSQISDTRLYEFDVRCFSHVLKKGTYRKFRLLKKGIILKTPEEHDLWEYHKHTLVDKPEWKWVFELEEELKQEYQQLYGLHLPRG